MQLFDAIYRRRSIRYFLDKPVPKRVLDKILDAARWAPSSCNQQLWHFVVVDKREIKELLVKKAGSSSLIINAPNVVAVCYDKGNIKEGIQSASAAVQNMLLAATELGIGSLWMDSIGNEEKIRKILGIPEDYFVMCFVLLGYPKKIPSAPARKGLELITHLNYFKKQKSMRFFHDPDKWNLDDIKEYQRFFCRKTELGTRMDVVNEKEIELIKHLLKNKKGSFLDVFSYDGSLIDAFPANKLFSLELTKPSSEYTKAATKKQVVGLVYDDKIGLKNNSIDVCTCFYKLERIPIKECKKLFSGIRRVLKDDGEFIILFRNSSSLYRLFYLSLRLFFRDDIRKTGLYSFFGPYKPLKQRKIVNQLRSAGFKVKGAKYFSLPPSFENIYDIFLQYKVSKGSSFIHRIKRKSIVSAIIRGLLSLQGLKKSMFGSTSLVVCKK